MLESDCSLSTPRAGTHPSFINFSNPSLVMLSIIFLSALPYVSLVRLIRIWHCNISDEPFRGSVLCVPLRWSGRVIVYYEAIKRELWYRSRVYECRCDERLEAKAEGFTYHTHTHQEELILGVYLFLMRLCLHMLDRLSFLSCHSGVGVCGCE